VYIGEVIFVMAGVLGMALVIRYLAGGRLPASFGVTILTIFSEVGWYGAYHHSALARDHLVAVVVLMPAVGMAFSLWGGIRAGVKRRATASHGPT
jgi:hypothetical protein